MLLAIFDIPNILYNVPALFLDRFAASLLISLDYQSNQPDNSAKYLLVRLGLFELQRDNQAELSVHLFFTLSYMTKNQANLHPLTKLIIQNNKAAVHYLIFGKVFCTIFPYIFIKSL